MSNKKFNWKMMLGFDAETPLVGRHSSRSFRGTAKQAKKYADDYNKNLDEKGSDSPRIIHFTKVVVVTLLFGAIAAMHYGII